MNDPGRDIELLGHQRVHTGASEINTSLGRLVSGVACQSGRRIHSVYRERHGVSKRIVPETTKAL